MKESLKDSKRKLLRNNEYYAMQPILDELYAKSKKGENFRNLMEVIRSENNILLAYRNIKTKEGRENTHRKLKYSTTQVIYDYLKNKNEYVEEKLFDNSVSLIAGQHGRCYITNSNLELGNMECHHKIPRSQGGTNEYRNLVWLTYSAHKLVHATQEDVILKYKNDIKIDEKGVKKLNYLRKLVGNSELVFD